jgi:peptidoglycan hydrolase-like protein with peptidoglycan-binding domain
VAQLQRALGLDDDDGVFGDATLRAVTQYQQGRGLPVDGIVGLGTWTALLSGQPPLAAGAPSPHKGLALLSGTPI